MADCRPLCPMNSDNGLEVFASIFLRERLRGAQVNACRPKHQGLRTWLPPVERRAADPVLAAHIGRLRSGFLLPQDPDDLPFRKTTWLHVHPPADDGLYPFLEEIPGAQVANKAQI